MAKIIAAGVFLIKKDGNLLICHPTNHNKNFWTIPKGKVDAGEDYVDAAIRETFEETNIDLSEFTNIRWLAPINYSHRKKMLHPFLVFEDENDGVDWGLFDIKCNSNVPEERGGFPEIDGYKWSTLDEARKVLHETQVYCIDAIERLLHEKRTG